MGPLHDWSQRHWPFLHCPCPPHPDLHCGVSEKERGEEKGGRKRGMKESGEIARTWKKEKKRMMMVIPQQSEGHDEHVSPASQCKSPHTPVYKN